MKMTPKKIEKLALESGLGDNRFVMYHLNGLKAFAQLVRNEVLEECAERCEGLTADWGDEAEEAGMRQCADAIRGLKS